MAPIIASIVSTLISNDLPKLGQAVLDKGLDVVEEKLGVTLEPQMSPEKLLEVKQAALKHEEFLTTQSIQNTTNAREMQNTALQQSDTFSKRFVYFFAGFWSICAVIYVAAISFMVIPENNIRHVDTILGFMLGTVISTILNFFLGSSAGSMKKTDMLIKDFK